VEQQHVGDTSIRLSGVVRDGEEPEVTVDFTGDARTRRAAEEELEALLLHKLVHVVRSARRTARRRRRSRET
jgi:hypothetical protein